MASLRKPQFVTARSISTQHPCTDVDQCEYYNDDTLTIDDHGLYSSECDYGNPSMQCPGASIQENLCKMTKTSKYKYLYTYSFKDFQKSREAANSPTGNVYALSNIPVSGANCTGNYGIAILGVKGAGLLPINVSVNNNFECDMVKDGSNDYYPVSGSGPVIHYPITLSVTVSNMKKGKFYNLYQYNSFAKVPQSNFNQHADNASQSWVIVSSTGSVTKVVKITNNQTAIFRAIPIDAP